MATKRKLTPQENRAIILYSLGCIILVAITLAIVILRLNTQTLRCDYSATYEDDLSEESIISLKWQFGSLVVAKTKTYYFSEERMSDAKKEDIKARFSAGDYFTDIEYGDWWSYQLSAEANYDLSKVEQSLGGTTYDEVKSHLETIMTCN